MSKLFIIKAMYSVHWIKRPGLLDFISRFYAWQMEQTQYQQPIQD